MSFLLNECIKLESIQTSFCVGILQDFLFILNFGQNNLGPCASHHQSDQQGDYRGATKNCAFFNVPII